MRRGYTRTPDDFRSQAHMFQKAIPQAATEPAQKEMVKQMISELKEGPVIGTYLVTKLQTLQTGKGKDYWALTLTDKSGSIEARMWDIPTGVPLKLEDFVSVIKGSVETYRDVLQMKITELAIVPDADVNLDDFLPTSLVPPEQMYASLCERINKMKDAELQKICTAVTSRLKPRLLRAPAATKMHDAVVGGLLQHILNLMGVVDGVCSFYKHLDLDLMIATCLLHDIGKTLELSAKKSLQYTTVGKLVGHVALGLSLVDTVMVGFKTPYATRILVLHMIASHHGELEWGAAAKPATAEAVAFHYIDNLTAKLSGIEFAIANDKTGGEFVYVPILRGELLR